MNEADTCRRLIVPKLQTAGWETEPHRINEQVTFTDGRIVVAGRLERVAMTFRACDRSLSHWLSPFLKATR
jgi:type I restriction enzyme R subunit